MNQFVFALVLIMMRSCFGIQQDGTKLSRSELDNKGTGHPRQVEQHILSGVGTPIKDRPYQVSLLINDMSVCGGFIVSEEYILTAAHCVKVADPSAILVRAGSSYLSRGTIIPIAAVWTHPEFNQPQYDKDVAVLKTAKKIVYSETIKAIRLASEGRIINPGTKVVLSGWGRTKETSSTFHEQLMSVEMTVVEPTQCALEYPDLLTGNEFCAGNNTCSGDYGGAATQDELAVGIAAYSRGCGREDASSVFTDIASKSVRDFIKEKTGL